MTCLILLTVHKHTHTNAHYCSHQSFASKLAVQQSDVLYTDWVEGDVFVHTVISLWLFIPCFQVVGHTCSTQRCAYVCACAHTHMPTHLCSLGLAGVGEQGITGALVFGHVDAGGAHVILKHCDAALLLYYPVSEKKHKTQVVRFFFSLSTPSTISPVRYNSALKCSPLKWAWGEPDGDLRVVTLKMHGWVGGVSPVWIQRRAWKFIAFCNADITGLKLGWAALPEASFFSCFRVKSTFRSQDEHLSTSTSPYSQLW